MAFKFVVLSALLAVASAGLLQPVTYAHVANPAVDAVASSHQNVVRTFDGTVSQYSKTIETPYSSVHKEDTRVSNNVYTPVVAKTHTYAAPAPTALYTHTAPVTKTVTYAAPAPVYHHEVSVPKTLSYVAPVVAKTVSYASPAPTPAALYTHATPIVSKSVYAPAHAHTFVDAPTVAKTFRYAAPASVYDHEAKTLTYAAPTPVYHHELPVAKTVSYAAPAPVYHHQAPVYHHAAPVATTHYNHGPAATTYTHNAPGVSSYGASQTVHYSPAETASHMSFDGFGTHWGW